MQKLKFINARGFEVEFLSQDPFVFWKLDGISLPPVEPIITQSVGQDGYTLHDIILDSRTITLTGHVVDSSGDTKQMYAERRKLMSVLNPAFGVGKLIYENDNGRWAIAAYCKEAPYVDKIRSVTSLNVSFECPSPYWQDAESTVISLAYVEGGLQFPIRTPGFFGTLGYRAVVDNNGDGSAPMEIYIDGGSYNPTIKNKSTGEFIRVEKHLNTSDKLYINTDPENLKVELIENDGIKETRSNAYGYLSFDSTLFTLQPGENDLIFTSDDENKKVKVRLIFKLLYVGV